MPANMHLKGALQDHEKKRGLRAIGPLRNDDEISVRGGSHDSRLVL